MRSSIHVEQIKRRRKRLQMDFESDPRALVTSTGSPQPAVDVEAICQPLTTNMVPDIAVIPEPTSPTPEVQLDQADLTVEGFLCRSTRKTYSNQNKTRRTPIHSDDKTPGSIRTTYKTKRGRRWKPPAKAKAAASGTKNRRRTRLPEALSRAVILTHGDPSEAIQGSQTLRRNCRPLTFVTMHKLDSLQRRATEDDDTIADSDSRNGDGPRTTMSHEPRNIGVRPRKPRAHKPVRSDRPRSGHPPLVLVPVREVEAAYSALFSHSRVSRACNKTPLPSTTQRTDKPTKSIERMLEEPEMPSVSVQSMLPNNPRMSAPGSPQEFTTSCVNEENDHDSKSRKPLKTFSSLLASLVERARSVTRQLDSCPRE
ncbi:hypothetical protein EDD15DRAFT_215706 [Pisolithus albus]|nr:hypothetical protein EDD15DRAFT_215706 [Pisolithus albus]